jgi:hypothetical protein
MCIPAWNVVSSTRASPLSLFTGLHIRGKCLIQRRLNKSFISAVSIYVKELLIQSMKVSPFTAFLASKTTGTCFPEFSLAKIELPNPVLNTG